MQLVHDHASEGPAASSWLGGCGCGCALCKKRCMARSQVCYTAVPSHRGAQFSRFPRAITLLNSLISKMDHVPCTALLPIDASGERGTARSVVSGETARGARRLPRRRAGHGLRLCPADQRLSLELPRHAFLDPRRRRRRRRGGAVGRSAVEQAEHFPAAIQACAAPTERPGAHGDGRGGGGGGGGDVYGPQRGPPPDAA